MSEIVDPKPGKDAAPKKPDEEGDSSMNPWERWTAGAIGLVATGAGTTAVFISDNQAGTAALFVVAVAFLLIGVQGTPLTRFASGDHSADFAARRTRRTIGREVVQEAVEAQQSGDSTTADNLVEVARNIDPSVEKLPAVREFRYARQVEGALLRLGFMTNMSPGHPRAADFLLVTNDGRQLPVETITRARPLGQFDFSRFSRLADQYQSPTLVVTDAPITPRSRTLMADFNQQDHAVPLEVVHWTGPDDDDLLVRAIGRMSRTAP